MISMQNQVAGERINYSIELQKGRKNDYKEDRNPANKKS
jgi:hypothetical protein